jgi:hypothetical protein
MADGVGDGSPGDGVGVETGTAAMIETVGVGFTAVGGAGLHAAERIASHPATTANHRRGTSHTSHDLTWGLSEGNALD